MNDDKIEDIILDTLLKIIDGKLQHSKDDFDSEELETDFMTGAMSDPTLKNQPHSVLRLALKPLLTEELRELLRKVLRDNPSAKKTLILKLSKGEFSKAVRDYIIGVLTLSLKHRYDGPREVLQEVLIRSNVNLRHEYSLTMDKTYQYAMEMVASPTFRPMPTPKPKPRGAQNGKDED